MNLLGEEDVGPQFFSPSRILAARAFQAAKRAKEEQEKLEKLSRKAEAAAIRQQRDLEKQERALQRQISRQLALEGKAQKEAERKAQNELEKALMVAQKATLQNNQAQEATSRRKRVNEEERGKELMKRRKTLPAKALGSSNGPVIRNSTIGSSFQTVKKVESTIEGLSVKKALKTSSRGRHIQLPQRFKI